MCSEMDGWERWLDGIRNEVDSRSFGHFGVLEKL